MKDIIKVAVVNFCPEWGNKEKNIRTMKEYIKQAALENANLILFPETCLSGYENEEGIPRESKMHTRLAETIDGPTALYMSKLANEKHMIIVYGFPEIDNKDPQIIYNSAAILLPDGKRLSYQKIHLPADESEWASPGNVPMVFNTEYGRIGLSICYDTYNFPALIQYAKARGARLFLNPTACNDAVFSAVPLRLMLECHSLTNSIYIASADLCGINHPSHFVGGSSIMGMSENSTKDITYYAGHPFGEMEADKEGMYIGEIDLSVADRCYATPMYYNNFRTGRPDFRPELYAEMFKSLSSDERWIKEFY